MPAQRIAGVRRGRENQTAEHLRFRQRAGRAEHIFDFGVMRHTAHRSALIVVFRILSIRLDQLVEERPLLTKRQRRNQPGRSPGRIVAIIHRPLPSAVRQREKRIVIILQPQANLLEVVAALHSPSGFACTSPRRQEDRDQDGDDNDHNDQLNQRKCFSRHESRSDRRGRD
ncbi:MAG TPA: hypothetical protein VLT84_07435, partial [Acidobacteriota bacterium]|nr:hypothetical protein [Acidobacteriota bacterium]